MRAPSLSFDPQLKTEDEKCISSASKSSSSGYFVSNKLNIQMILFEFLIWTFKSSTKIMCMIEYLDLNF